MGGARRVGRGQEGPADSRPRVQAGRGLAGQGLAGGAGAPLTVFAGRRVAALAASEAPAGLERAAASSVGSSRARSRLPLAFPRPEAAPGAAAKRAAGRRLSAP